MAPRTTDLDRLAIDTIRTLSMDAVEKAASGHPGTPMACAPLAWILFSRLMKHSPANPAWPDRDRFVLSAGHASMLLYSALHLSGYAVTLDDLRSFRQWKSRTPGHPENFVTTGVETTTGPLGQGLGNAVGMAIAERHLAARFNRPDLEVVDHRTWVLASDGDLMEGVSHEAASLAGHFGLSRLTVFWDDNRITIEGATDLAFSEDVGKRFAAYGWHIVKVADMNDLGALARAAAAAIRETARPTLVIVRSRIAFGAPTKEGTAEAHGAPLGREEVRGAKRALGWPEDEEFRVPEAVRERGAAIAAQGAAAEAAWTETWREWRGRHADLAAAWDEAHTLSLASGYDSGIPAFAPGGRPVATRNASGVVLNALAPKVPYLIGGSADLAPSTKTLMKGAGDFSRDDAAGRNFHFGIREHGMGSAMNGMALHGGVRPFGSTFLVFSDYARPAIRLAALMRLPVIWIFTHDSIGLGEDGPTHQPVEHLAALRAIPGLTVIRPADAAETAEAWRHVLETPDGPAALVLSRQDLPILERTALAPATGLRRGGYVLAEAEGGDPEAVLIASGSEVAIALEARRILSEHGLRTRVVSLPSFEIFERQDEAWRRTVLPPGLRRRVVVEAASPFGLHRYAGDSGLIVALPRFGASAPAETLYREFGLTAENVAAAALSLA